MRIADKPVRIGMLGCGVVGSEVARLLLADSAELSTRAGIKIELAKIAVRTINSHEGIDPALFTTDPFSIVNDPEIDLIIDNTDICIEYNGLYYHTEKMGKTSSYHLNKTIECNQIGYKLIHIFEDEWKTKQDLVKTKLKHLLKVNNGVKIGGSKHRN